MSEPAPITIRFPGALRDYCAGASEVVVLATNVRTAFAAVEQAHPALYACFCDETGTPRRHLGLFVNATHLSERNGLDTPLRKGDVLTVLPAVSGG